MPRKTVTLAWLASCLLPLLCALLCAPSARAEMPGAAGFCFWTRTLADGRAHQTFLRRRPGGQLALYHAVWAPDGRHQECVTSRDSAVTHGYRAECQERRPELFSRRAQRSFQTRVLFRPGVCVDADADAGADVGVGGSAAVRHTRDLLTQQHAHTEGSRSVRVKRGLIMIPGTLWCGTGNTAANYSDLGAFPHTDECCREHDHCTHTIASFNYGFGVFNSNIFTLSHCDCDNRFKQCLQRAEDAMGFVVGYGYFNVLKMRCFEWTIQTECTERAWWGRCLSTGPVRYAEVQEPTDYNSTLTENGTLPYPSQLTKLYSEMTTKPVSDLIMKPDSHPTTKPDSEHTTKPDSEHTTKPDRAPTTKPASALTSKPNQDGSSELKLPTPAQSIMPTINLPDPRTDASDARTDLLNNRTDVSDHAGDLQGSTPSSSLLLPTPTTTTTTTPKPSDTLRVCGVYKLLDDCRLQVPPLQEVFGLKNTELRTLYHCNCTKRLAEHMPVLEAAGLHTLMLDFVAESCFILPHTQSSDSPQSSAVLLQMPFFLPGRGWDKRPAGRRHLLDRPRKFNQSKRAKRKDLGVRLYRKCLRMHSRLQKPRRH
ncbi:group 3 secretory phospholipase A2 [Sardina pilchardus]|uniref:group 3 secretory phospholipase A2 n=1 Tax=Sardina pilchardus TaxID=27697 RepID=UPI002E156C54